MLSKNCLVWYVFLSDHEGWKKIFFRQVAKILLQVLNNTVDKLHIIIRGDVRQRREFKDYINAIFSTNKLLIIELDLDLTDKSEYQSIKYVWDLARKDIFDNIIYCHLKGVSFENSANKNNAAKFYFSLEWGDYLEWAIIERAAVNIKVLKKGNFDVLGCNYIKYIYNSKTTSPLWWLDESHNKKESKREAFSGNFWVATAKHIRSLDRPLTPSYLIQLYGDDDKSRWRTFYEFWITSKEGNYANAYKSHSIKDPTFHYTDRLFRSNYSSTIRIALK